MFKQPLPKKTPKYLCKLCDFTTSNKKDYVKHLQTIKHNTAKTQGFLNNSLKLKIFILFFELLSQIITSSFSFIQTCLSSKFKITYMKF